MKIPRQKKSELNLSGKSRRYWSLMLVGEHGRVIPVRRFKEMAIAIFAVALLSLGALIVLGLLYFRQGQALQNLRHELVAANEHVSRLKDEKDVLSARLGIKKALMGPDSPDVETRTETTDNAAAAPAPQPVPEPAAAESGPAVVQSKPVEKKPPAVKPPEVKWRADIRNFSVDYDPKRNILKASFRVYNTSLPKHRLSGKSVVVFKNKAEPPIKWFAVPNVLLSNGQPDGKIGQAFNINNYITMRHNAYNQKAPIDFDAAVVYVFSSAGELLKSAEFDFKIDYQPPPPKPETKAASAKEQTKTPPAPTPPADVEPESRQAPVETQTPAEKPAMPDGDTGKPDEREGQLKAPPQSTENEGAAPGEQSPGSEQAPVPDSRTNQEEKPTP